MTAQHPDSFGARDALEVGGRELEIFRLDALQDRFDVARLPFSLRILLENLLRTEDGVTVTAKDIEALAGWDPAGPASIEIAFTPSRVLMQDFTGVPAIVDLAAMRDAMEQLGGDPTLINPMVPVELVIDHSIQVDVFGEPRAFQRNAVSGHAGGHGLAHHDDQRAGRARLGRGRDRGRGRDARPAHLHADPRGRRVPADRRAAGGLDRHGPRPHRDPDAARAPRGQQVRGVLRARTREAAARGPRDDRQHVSRVRRDLRHLPGRRRDAALSRVHRALARAGRARRGVLPCPGTVPRAQLTGAGLLGQLGAGPRDR